MCLLPNREETEVWVEESEAEIKGKTDLTNTKGKTLPKFSVKEGMKARRNRDTDKDGENVREKRGKAEKQRWQGLVYCEIWVQMKAEIDQGEKAGTQELKCVSCCKRYNL